MSVILVIFLADYLIYFIFLCLPFFLWKGEIQLGVRAVLALSMAFFIASGIKYFWPSERPFQMVGANPALVNAPDASFPSLHAALAFALAFTVLLTHKRYGSILVLCAFLVGLARVLAQVHYPIDILGGVVVGGGVAWFIHLLRVRL